MINYLEIKDRVERKSIHPHRHINLPRLTNAPYDSPEYNRWVEENWWMINCTVFMDDKPRAMELAKQLDAAFKQDEHHPTIPGIVAELKKLQVKDYGELTPLEVWTRSSYTLAVYCDSLHAKKTIMDRLSRYKGTILEAMCGQATYFEDSPERKVVALDYCKESLLRYPVPERTRILCDLDQLKRRQQIGCFGPGTFDVVSVCFGMKYPKHIGPLVREFRRILRPGGTLSFIENELSGYQQCIRRFFDKDMTRELLVNNGYREVRIKHIPVEFWEDERGKYYHIEAIKPI